MAYFNDNVVLLVVAAMAVAAFVLLLSRNSKRLMPYQSRGPLLTAAERQFYRVLVEVVADRWLIFAMVRLADILTVSERTPAKSFRGWHNRIAGKHVDFVLCDKDALEVVAAIELDDASHQAADRVERDAFVEAAFRAADIPLLRFPVQATYSLREISQRLGLPERGHARHKSLR